MKQKFVVSWASGDLDSSASLPFAHFSPHSAYNEDLSLSLSLFPSSSLSLFLSLPLSLYLFLQNNKQSEKNSSEG